jgi:hypothetical protein
MDESASDSLCELLADTDHRGLDEAVQFTVLAQSETYTKMIQGSTFTFRKPRMSANAFKTSLKCG